MSKLTHLADRFEPGLGFRKGALSSRDPKAAEAIVFHTTGSGPWKRATTMRWAVWRRRHDLAKGDVFGAALVIYTKIMKASGHFLVGQDGELVQLVPLDHSAWHVGSKRWQLYRRATWDRARSWVRGSRHVAWWRTTFPRLASPLDLAGGKLWDLGSANLRSVGIEVVPPLSGPRDQWSPACWATLRRLSRDIREACEIAERRDMHISHSEAHPLARSARKKPWDAGPVQWQPERLSLAA